MTLSYSRILKLVNACLGHIHCCTYKVRHQYTLLVVKHISHLNIELKIDSALYLNSSYIKESRNITTKSDLFLIKYKFYIKKNILTMFCNLIN